MQHNPVHASRGASSAKVVENLEVVAPRHLPAPRSRISDHVRRDQHTRPASLGSTDTRRWARSLTRDRLMQFSR